MNNQYNFLHDFIAPLNKLVNESAAAETDGSGIGGDNGSITDATHASHKKIVLTKYLNDVNESLKDLQLLLEEAQDVIDTSNYEEKYIHLRQEANKTKHFTDTITPLLSLYTLF